MSIGKTRQFLQAQRRAICALESFRREQHGRVVWFHAASLGEYNIIKPIIRALRSKEQCQVVLTFFSPTGFNAVRPSAELADYVFYLPIGRPKRFLSIIRPDLAVFAVSELWPDYLKQLQKRGIPAYLVSAVIRRPSKYFAWYGATWRKALRRFTRIFVLDEASRTNLAQLGITQVSVVGNPLFDNAIAIADTPWTDPLLERFCSADTPLVAGSIDALDLPMLSTVLNRQPKRRCIIVPHELGEPFLRSIEEALTAPSIRYTDAMQTGIPDDAQYLIVNTIGILPYLYRYGSMAYIGGGFTRYLHSVLEATVYGLPVAFGPRIERKVTPQQLIRRNLGRIVSTPDELEAWWNDSMDKDVQAQARIDAKAYVEANRNATQTIAKQLN